MPCSALSRVVKQVLVCATLAAGPITSSGIAWAEPGASAAAAQSDDSAEFMERGFAELKRGDLEAAHAAFAEAWARRPQVVVALSLAEIEMRLGRFVDAAEHWQYLVLQLPQNMAEQRELARAQLELARREVGTLTLQVTPDGATVMLDDKPIGQGPLGRELYVEPGIHTVYAAQDDRRSVVRTFQASAGGRLSFSLVVPTASMPPSGHVSSISARSERATLPSNQPGEPRPASAPSFRRPLLIAGGALAVASAAVGTYFAFKSSKALDDASLALDSAVSSNPSVPRSSACYGAERPDACETVASKVADADHFRNVSVGSFIGAGVFAAATLTTLMLWRERQSTPVAGSDAVRISLAPAVGPFRGLELSGRF